jgi:EAL domain-containing protein (putative c-di-GMP-specific phosphodiesterase class I)
MSASADRPAIARAIVELGRTLGLKVVAEGIEEPDQAAWLISLGCPLGQGYLFSRPMGVDATEAFLAADATRRVQEHGSAADSAETGTAARHGGTPLRLVSGE